MAHKRGVERDVAAVFLKELSRHGSVRKACLVAGVTRSWVRTQRLNSEFAEAYADALEDSVDRIEEAGVHLALSNDERMIRYLLDARRYKKPEGSTLGQVKPSITVTIGG